MNAISFLPIALEINLNPAVIQRIVEYILSDNKMKVFLGPTFGGKMTNGCVCTRRRRFERLHSEDPHTHNPAAVVQCYRVFSIRWNTMPLPQALRKIDARRKCEEFSASLRAVASKGGTYHGKLWKLRCGWWWLPCASGANDSIAQLLGASVVRIVIFIFITTAAHRAP